MFQYKQFYVCALVGVLIKCCTYFLCNISFKKNVMHLAFHCNIVFHMKRLTAEIRLSVQLMGLTPVNFMFVKTN